MVVEGPRSSNWSHLLSDILVIPVCAAICGADSWAEVEAYGKAKEAWLRRFLRLPHGIPARDTFGRVFAPIDPDRFQCGFIKWVQKVHEIVRSEVIVPWAKAHRIW